MEVRRMYKDKFVLSILHDGHPVKETGRKNTREVAIPFDSEYQVRLKNKNDRSCTARIFIDDKKVSQLGDIIVSAGGTVDLERYIDRSLKEGKKFKFVSLDHEDVDDPTDSSNGIIKVEFRLAKQKNDIKINAKDNWYPPIWYDYKYKEDNNGTQEVPQRTYTGGTTGGLCGQSVYTSYNCSNVKSLVDVEAGATVEGGHSNQSFSYSDIEVEDNAVILQLKIIGIKKDKKMYEVTHKYCAQCGNKALQVDKYCSKCGQRL